VAFGIKVVQQYEQGVVFRLGRLRGLKGPGLRAVIPIIDKVRKVDMRTITLPIPQQQIITRDNVSIGVAAVAYYRAIDPIKTIVDVEDVVRAIYEIAQTTVRNIVGQSALDTVLSETAVLNDKLRGILEHTGAAWGIEVQRVELKDIALPVSMQRAMAREAEAEREKRAKIIDAEGEALSADRLAEAADTMAAHPIALQLRNLQVLGDIASEQNSTIIFPAPLMDSLSQVAAALTANAAATGTTTPTRARPRKAAPRN
jgi:regulator of protease activity HflC (stomatin/prohibitin superfamily)